LISKKLTMNVALLGCGAIGSEVAKAIDEGKAGPVKLLWVFDRHKDKAEELSRLLKSRPKVAREMEEILSDKEVQLVIEAASQEAVREYGEGILASGKDLLILSTGALMDHQLFAKLLKAKKSGRRIYIPSGAILGLDALKACELAGVEEVELTTRKPSSSLGEPPGLLFEGSVREAIKRFPRAINIAATLALVVGEEKVRVRILSDASVKRTTHELRIRSKISDIFCRVESTPFEQNPLSSKITAHSVVRLLRDLTEPVKIGT
jgi:aspartate dehydrogenase